ncbi:MAG: AI-2E family transporter [Candidatus Faecivicinus sp.]
MHIEWKSCLRVGVSAFLLFLAIYYWKSVSNLGLLVIQAAVPLVTGAVIAYVANILMSFYERRLKLKSKHWQKIRRPACMGLAFLTVVLALLLLIRLIIPQLVSCFQVLLNALPGAIESLYNWLEENFNISAWMAEQAQSIPESETDWESLLKNVVNVLFHGVGGAMNAVVEATASLVGGVVTLFLSLIFAVYLLLGKERLGSQFTRLMRRALGESRTEKVIATLRVFDECFHSYIVGQCLEALILGSLCAVGMMILRLPYSLMIGALVGVTALIPIAGAYIGGALGAVMVFSVAPMNAVIFLIFLVILQQIEGNLIYPRTVGSSLGLPAIWVLAAVTVGGGVLGIAGMLLFVPLTAAVYRLLGDYVRRGEIQPQRAGSKK